MTSPPGKLKLNLGCGSRQRPGYINVDASPVCRPDVVLDLEQTPWPWPDDAVGEVVLIHVLEHLGQQPAVFLKVMQELWRVCCDGARIHIEVPHPRSDEFWGDPTHVRPITADGLALFSRRNNAEYARIGAANTPLGEYLGIDLELVASNLIPKRPWLERLQRGEISEEALRAAGDSQWNVYANYQATLQVIKPAGRLVMDGAGQANLDARREAAQAALAAGDGAAAIAALEALCAADPGDFEARCQLAACLHAGGDLEGARRHYQAVVDAGARSFELFNNLGVACLDLGEAAAAVRNFSQALEMVPGDRLVRGNLAEAKAAAGDVRDAIEMFTALVQEQPEDAGVYVAMAKVFLDQGWFADAGNALAMARRFGADSLELCNLEGIACREQYRYAEAVERFDAGLALEPGNAALHTNRANALAWLGRDETAEAGYRQALAAAPEDPEARFSYACFLLMRGRTDPGWQYYEARWERGDTARTRRPPSRLPQWCGEATDPAGDALLVYCEQGFGDNLQFVRLLARIRPAFARVVLVARPALATLFARALEGIAEVVSETPDETAFTWQVPLVSIACALALPVAEWTMDQPYLRSDPLKAMLWQSYLPAPGKRRVGLCWSGGKRPRHRHRFDLPLPVVETLLACQGVAWVGLQQSGFDEWRQGQAAAGRLTDPMGLVRDFDDTAALVASLDLVVTTDTAVAHLAGALGKPAWLLLSSEGEWRWLQGRSDTPWYPSLRLFRQATPGDWAGVGAAVLAALGDI